MHRFKVQAGLGDGASSLNQVPSAFGDYAGLLTQPRVMQFALRYEFWFARWAPRLGCF